MLESSGTGGSSYPPKAGPAGSGRSVLPARVRPARHVTYGAHFMAVRLSWAPGFDGIGRWPAPGPDDDIFKIKFEPCPPEVGDLPPPIAAACAAAVEMAETTSTLVHSVRHFIPEERLSADHRQVLFLLLWWRTVGMVEPARERVYAAARHLNKGGRPVAALGTTAISAHHIAIEYAHTHTAAVCLAAIGMYRPTAGVLDPAELCRQPARRGQEHPNQLIQDALLSGLDVLIGLYRKREYPTDVTGLRAKILVEARAAAESFEAVQLPDGRPTGCESIDDIDARILAELAKRRPMRLMTDFIAKATKLGEGTVKDRINTLIANNYASRPQGRKSGATITPDGIAVLTAVGWKL